MRFASIVLVLVSLSAQATIWHVRNPGSGPYGSGDGTSYANAWTAITNIQYGSGKVVSGDTIHLYGTNILTVTGNGIWLSKGQASIGADNLTFVGDTATDPFCGFNGAVDHFNTLTWLGPDGNGVYWTTNEVFTSARKILYEVDGLTIQPLGYTNVRTWAGSPGYVYWDGVTNFVKMFGNSVPSNNVATDQGGWLLDFNGHTNIQFLNCVFIGGRFISQSGSGYVPTAPNFTSGANHEGFTGCTFYYNFDWELFPGNDFFGFTNCNISYADFGVYGYQNGQTRGAWNCTVTGCDIGHTYIDPDVFRIANDLHAVAGQGCNNWVIIGNTLHDTGGTAIDINNIGNSQGTNVLIARNFIHDITGLHNSGDGIAVDTGLPYTVGTQSALVIERNIIFNVNINGQFTWNGIGINSIDPVNVFNNVVAYAGHGLFIDSGASVNQAVILNNIFYNTTNALITVNGTGTTNSFACDYNLFFTNVPPATPFSFTPSVSHDTHGVFSNPVFFSVNNSAASNFKVRFGGPASGAATNANAGVDFDGSAVVNNTTIGAWQALAAGIFQARAANMRMSQ